MSESEKLVKKPECKYGSSCYRRSRDHISKFSHTEREEDTHCSPPRKKQNKITDVSENSKAEVCELYASLSSSTSIFTAELKSAIKIECERAFHLVLPDDSFDFYQFFTELKKNRNSKSNSYSYINHNLDLKIEREENQTEDNTGEKFEMCGPLEVMRVALSSSTCSASSSNMNEAESATQFSTVKHFRFYNDPPEFVTVLVKKHRKTTTNNKTSDDQNDNWTTSTEHFGYFRDDPLKQPDFVVFADPAKTLKITPIGLNLFDAYLSVIERRQSQFARKTIQQHNGWKKYLHEDDAASSLLQSVIKRRKRSVVCPLASEIGLRVDVDENEIGYRELPCKPKKLHNIMNSIVECGDDEKKRNSQFERLDELTTFVQIANDEGDFGEGLELGLNMLAFQPLANDKTLANLFNRQIASTLSVSYESAKRDAFSQVITEHMENRKFPV